MSFKKTFLLGGLLGAGLMWLSTTKKGKELREQAIEYAQEVYNRTKKEVKQSGGWDTFTRTKFNSLVEDVTNKYADEIGMAKHVTKVVAKMVESQWNRLRNEMER